MRRRFLLVSNATAGCGHQGRVSEVIAELESRGCTVETLSDNDLGILDQADKLKKYDAVIAAGGDGTVRRLLMTEAGQAVPVGIIPNGTGNVLAHEIGLRMQPSLIGDVLIAGPELGVHTAQFGSDLSLLMVGFGFDGRIIHRLNLGLKSRIGKAAYISAVLASLAEYQPSFQITIDGKVHAATWAIIANARRYGGSFMLAPEAGLTKRPFQVVLFQSSSRLIRLRQLYALATGRVESAPQTTVVAGHEIQLDASRCKGLKAQVDGDPIEACPSHITAGKDVRLIVPNRFIR